MIMSDIVDLAQERIDIETERSLSKSRVYRGESSLYCHECLEPIPEARREAVKGCCLCVSCQQIEEIRGRNGH